MLYRVFGMLFLLFGSFLVLGHLLGGNAPRFVEGGVASEYNNLITGAVLLAVGLYACVKSSGKKA
jgi:hypothetical protein